MVRSHNLHAIVKQLHQGDLCVRRKEKWGPITDGAATASIEGSIVGTPVNVSGTGELSPIAEYGGARLGFRITVHVRVPLIGGKVEKAHRHPIGRAGGPRTTLHRGVDRQ